MFAVGLGAIADAVFASSTMLIAVPTGVKIFNWIGTMYRGSVSLKTPMLFAIGFISMFIIGGLSGIMHASPPADLIQHDTYFIVAHIHYVLIGGSIMALIAGVYYWFPKMSGRIMDETLGKWNFWTFVIFFNLTFMPMHWTGLLGMPRRVYTYGPELGVTTLNQISTIGALGLGAVVRDQHFHEFAQRRGRHGRSLGRGDARVVDTVTAAALQLCAHSSGALP
jgi:heme/copper-type cytochrome/quinol oxidase subunit 1